MPETANLERAFWLNLDIFHKIRKKNCVFYKKMIEIP